MHQVEYAMEAVKQGSAAVGLKVSGCHSAWRLSAWRFPHLLRLWTEVPCRTCCLYYCHRCVSVLSSCSFRALYRPWHSHVEAYHRILVH